jgi:hypothetical protein
MAAKRGPKPKDLSVYLEEAREERRRFPKLKANGIGDRIAKRHPEVKGLAQAIRKALKKEEKETSSALPKPDPPTPPPSSPASPLLIRPASRMPGRRFKSAAQRAQEAYDSSLGQRLEGLGRDLEKLKYAKKMYEEDQKTVEALMRDPTFRELLRILQEDED